MSRSYRKTPIIGHTTCSSEKEDKKLWHQRWRARQRIALANLPPDAMEAYLPLPKNQISSVWSMGKDSHAYWPIGQQITIADHFAICKGRNPQERAPAKKRLLHKWMSK